MAARYILALLSGIFLCVGAARVLRERTVGPAARTWLMVGVIFAAVSAWLWIAT